MNISVVTSSTAAPTFDHTITTATGINTEIAIINCGTADSYNCPFTTDPPPGDSGLSASEGYVNMGTPTATTTAITVTKGNPLTLLCTGGPTFAAAALWNKTGLSRFTWTPSSNAFGIATTNGGATGGGIRTSATTTNDNPADLILYLTSSDHNATIVCRNAVLKAPVTVTLKNEADFQIVSGNDAGNFALDAETGKLTTAKSPLTAGEYTLTIEYYAGTTSPPKTSVTKKIEVTTP